MFWYFPKFTEQTRNLLIQVATKLNSPIHTSEDIRLTKPRIVCTQSLLEDHLAKYIKEEDRIPLLSMKHVTLDDRGKNGRSRVLDCQSRSGYVKKLMDQLSTKLSNILLAQFFMNNFSWPCSIITMNVRNLNFHVSFLFS